MPANGAILDHREGGTLQMTKKRILWRNKGKLLSSLLEVLPGSQHVERVEVDLDSEEDAIRIGWRGNRFRVSLYGAVEVEEERNTFLASSNLAILLKELLRVIAAKITSMIRANVSNRIERLRNTGHQFGMPATKRGPR